MQMKTKQIDYFSPAEGGPCRPWVVRRVSNCSPSLRSTLVGVECFSLISDQKCQHGFMIAPERFPTSLFQRRNPSFGTPEFSHQVFVDPSVACYHSRAHRNNLDEENKLFPTLCTPKLHLAYRAWPLHCDVSHPDLRQPEDNNCSLISIIPLHLFQF